MDTTKANGDQPTNDMGTILAARDRLQDPVFRAAMLKLKDRYAMILFSSAPDEKSKREELYRRNAVLDELMMELQDIADEPVQTAV